MSKSANELMQEILFSVFLDSVDALKRASGGLPNQLVRDLNGIHANITFADLPKEVQDALTGNVRAAFSKLLKEGYAVAPTTGRPGTAPSGPKPPPRGPNRSGPGGGRSGPLPPVRPKPRSGS